MSERDDAAKSECRDLPTEITRRRTCEQGPASKEFGCKACHLLASPCRSASLGTSVEQTISEVLFKTRKLAGQLRLANPEAPSSRTNTASVQRINEMLKCQKGERLSRGEMPSYRFQPVIAPERHRKIGDPREIGRDPLRFKGKAEAWTCRKSEIDRESRFDAPKGCGNAAGWPIKHLRSAS